VPAEPPAASHDHPAPGRQPPGTRPAPAPLSTYRLQLSPDFGFDAVAEVAGYLAELGVSHAYLSPCLQAAPGSTHGYDVVDPTRVSDDLGGAAAHARMCDALGRSGLGQVLDLVPNHMAITGPENLWWWDVLENGPASTYASWFDVDWDPPEARLRNSVLLPVLGDHYGRALEAGELSVSREGGALVVHYYDLAFPIAPSSIDTLLWEAAKELAASDAPGAQASEGRDELESIATALGRLPPSSSTDRSSVRERHRDKEVLRQRLGELCDRVPAVARVVDGAVSRLNTDAEGLDALLERQSYRLAYWRAADQDLDYRRFFDISTLVGLRVEDEEVFAQTHALVLAWLRDHVVDGLRIDHIDGLRDPATYLERLAQATDGAWVVVEKILEPGEHLVADWSMAGTTGYDFATLVGGLFVDPASESALTDIYSELTGEADPFEEVVHQARHQVMAQALAADLRRLTSLMMAVCQRHRRYRDFTRLDLSRAIEEVIACFDVYRTYVGEGVGEDAGDGTTGPVPRPAPTRPASAGGPASPQDMARIDHALAEAARHQPDIDPELACFIGRLLVGDSPAPAGEPETELRMRFQQVTPPVMAKAVEDTAYYVYNRLVCANEVGGDPAHPASSPSHFHQVCRQAQQDWPATMVATSSHDTKRGEDVRARIALLSELPAQWADSVRRWAARNQPHRRDDAHRRDRAGDQPGPDLDRNAEYLLYQTLVGAWPIDAERVVAYMAKATREAKQHTSWTDPDPGYDAAVEHFVRAVLADQAFVAELEAFVTPLVEPGRVTSLAQALCRLTAPGVPDTYQGCELWESNLVDPDNRRPVDFERRRELLGQLSTLAGQADRGLSQLTGALEDPADDGLPKLAVTRAALRLRNQHPEWFGAASSYRALPVTGDQADHLVAFTRSESVVTVAPRLVIGLAQVGGWGDTQVELPFAKWQDHLTGACHSGGPVPLDQLLSGFPVALLVREGQ